MWDLEYSYDEVLENTIKYFDGGKIEADTFTNKYPLHDGDIYYELTPDDMHKRMAHKFAEKKEENKKNRKIKEHPALSDYGKNRSELTKDRIYNLFKDFKYIIPQGRVMAGLGSPSFRSLSNCITLPSPKDSYSSIMYVDTMLVNAAKRGCGYGIGLSNLRPNEAATQNAADTSTGIVPFMERYSRSTREVGQNSRRGACLLAIDIRHPQVLDFAQAKQNRDNITGANISIKIRNDFMEAVQNNDDYLLRFPVDISLDNDSKITSMDDLPYNEIVKGELGYYKKVRAQKLYNSIVQIARNDSEPGLFLWDHMLDYDPVNVYEYHKIICTNACGEQPMGALDTCRLIVQNLLSYVENPFTENASFDFDLFYRYSYETLRLGDLLVDLEIDHIDRIINKIKHDPEPKEEKQIELVMWEQIKEKAQRGRRVGSGITGLGDMLAALNISYDSDKALQLTQQVMKTKMKAELDATTDLSIEYGSFPDWDSKKEFSENGKGNNGFYQFLQKEFPKRTKKMRKYGRRNINWSTISPTGSVSILTQTSSGCEPVFQAYYMRRRKINPSDKNIQVDYVDQSGDSWQEYPVLHPQFANWILKSTQESKESLINLSKQKIEKYYKNSPWFQSTAYDIDWKQRVKMQAVLQQYTSSAISSTINLPEDIPVEKVKNIYEYAWKKGLKGITVYRENSRSGVLVSSDKEKKDKFEESMPPKRPKKLPCDIHRFQTDKEEWIMVIGLYGSKGKPYEVFTGPSSEFEELPKSVETGYIVKSKPNGSGKYDLCYKYYNKEYIAENLQEVFDPLYHGYNKVISSLLRHGQPVQYLIKVLQSLHFKNDSITSWGSGVIRYLKKYIPDGTEYQAGEILCNCDSIEETNYVYQEGCLTCLSCGQSRCG